MPSVNANQSELNKLKRNLFVQLTLVGLLPLIALTLVTLKVGLMADGIRSATSIETLARSERTHYKAFVDGVVEAVDLEHLPPKALAELDLAEVDLRGLQQQASSLSELEALYANIHEQSSLLHADSSLAALLRLRAGINTFNTTLDAMTNRLEEESRQQIELLIATSLTLRYALFGLVAFMLILLLLVVRYMIRRLTLPLQTAIGLCKNIADGQLRADKSLIADGGDIGGLVANIERMRQKWTEVIFQLTEHTQKMRLSSNNLTAQVADLEENAHQQSKAASSIEASMEEMTANMDRIADRAHQATTHAETGGQVASTGMAAIDSLGAEVEQVANLIDKAALNVNDLDAKAAGIGVIITVISELADQTNLLALNAAIEAARAGNAGRGFAVVAEEVRKLADRTDQSIQSISTIVSEMKSAINQIVISMQGSVARVQHSVELGREAAIRMNEVKKMSASISSAIDIVDHSIREQRRAAEEIEQRIMSIVSSAENHAASGKTVSESAQMIDKTAGAISVDIAFFKTDN